MRHLDEGTVHAFVDGALDAARVREVEAHLAACAACRDAVGEARGLVAASSRILTALDAVPGGVLPPRGPTPPEARPDGRGRRDGGTGFSARDFTSRWGWAVAAVMVLAVGGVLLLRTEGRRRTPERLAAERPRAASAPAPAPANSAGAALQKSVAAPPPRAMVAPAAPNEAVRVGAASIASREVVDSTARAERAPAPRQLSVDSVRTAGGVVVRTRYAWTNGIVLTLLATPPGVHAAGGVAADAMPLRTAPAAKKSVAPVAVIQWTGPDGTRYRLSGAMSAAELQRARAALF